MFDRIGAGQWSILQNLQKEYLGFKGRETAGQPDLGFDCGAVLRSPDSHLGAGDR
ncbi:MAG: hypothetical protein AAFN27_24585 [Pseudomonadota bacterium]